MPKLKLHALALNPHSHRIIIENHYLDIGPTEFRLMKFLLSHKENVFNRDQLLNHVWGRNVDERTVDVYIRRLRKALAPFGYDRYIQTVRGYGYRLSKNG